MEIEVDQSKLAKALSVVSRIAGGAKATLPILNNVLIRADNGKVTLTSTNLDMAVVDYIPVAKSVDGVITVPAKLIAEFVSNLPKGLVKMKVNGTKITVSMDKYKSVVNGSLADDYPELPGIDEEKAVKFRIGVDEFKMGVNEVMIASSNDLTRPALTGVYFNTNDGVLYVAATDGYRLAERKFIPKVESEVKAIVPSASLSEVMRSLNDEVDEIEILFNDSQVRFRLGEIEITSKLIDGSFPDYRQLIPNEVENSTTLKRSDLSRVTKLAALFAREVGGSIVCETRVEPGVFVVSSVANEFGENDSEIEAEVKVDGKVVLNARYLTDALNALEDEELVFGFSGKLSPVIIKNKKTDRYTHIIMPLKS